MTRYYVDCRETPSVTGCTVSIAADDQEELVEAAANHMSAVHGHEDAPEIREEIRASMHEGDPPR